MLPNAEGLAEPSESALPEKTFLLFNLDRRSISKPLEYNMLSILRKARLKDKEMRILMLYVLLLVCCVVGA